MRGKTKTLLFDGSARGGWEARAAHKLNAIDKVVETRRHSHSDG
jgi:hypothetical protein